MWPYQYWSWYTSSCISHTTAFKFCRLAHLLNKLLMSKINLHISSNFFKLLCIGKRCFQPEVAKSSQFMCFLNWAPMLVNITSWTGVWGFQKLHLLALAAADNFLIEKHRNKLIWRHLWMMLCGCIEKCRKVMTAILILDFALCSRRLDSVTASAHIWKPVCK